jgi:heparan-alpha-glucosaminide N-acetyltransferase
MQQLPNRLSSIDVLRAITMLLMIFVNDSSGLKHIPVWIDHAKEYEDALGFADIIFPGFLFIVGLSLPFAIKNRMKKGDPPTAILFYILTRSAALLIMGFYHVNLEEYNSDAAILPHAVWELIITFSFFLIWLDYPETMQKAKKYTLMSIGIIALIVMAILYKGGSPDHPTWMHTSWWGILGIIGWSYLVCALAYFVFKGRLSAMIIVYAVFAAINIAVHSVFPHTNFWVIGDAASVTLTMGGVVISGVYAYLVEKGRTERLWGILTAAGVLLITVGLVIRPYTEGISKIRSTPSWVFICSGITILVFELLIYVVDIKGKKNFFKIISPAGTSTLTCYLIPYIQVSLIELLGIEYPRILNNGVTGLLRSMATAFIIIWVGGLLEKKRLRLKI